MTAPYPQALSLSRLVLRALLVLNVFYGLCILILLFASIVAEGPVFTALGVKQVEGSARMIQGMRLIAVVGLVAVPFWQFVIHRLIAIVDTVRAGDPFVLENAVRLQAIAWAVLGLECLHMIVGGIAAVSGSSAQPLDVDWSFSVTPWIAVLLLFVLARVFDHGARMRADLEGTV